MSEETKNTGLIECGTLLENYRPKNDITAFRISSS